MAKIQPVVDQVVDFAAARDAFDRLDGRRHVEKIVIRFAGIA